MHLIRITSCTSVYKYTNINVLRNKCSNTSANHCTSRVHCFNHLKRINSTSTELHLLTTFYLSRYIRALLLFTRPNRNSSKNQS